MIRNLGQVAAIYIGSSAPRNTNLIWLDNTVVPFVFRAYDGSAWSEIATHKWVRAYVDGWLVTLPPRQLADDGDYMLINSNNVNYKITVKDFVKSAVGNPLDFKGVIRVSADFPNPSTLESGDMYVIITSPAGGTVTDPYSGKTFEDSEKIVWDEVTQSWESLGKIDITVDLTTSYSETEVTIHSSAGKETTIQGATDQLAGVMLPGQYLWLQALSNGSIVPGDSSPLTPLTPAHKHNYNDIINRLVSQQGTGESTIDPMSQKATTDALNLKFDKASVLQVSGAATDKVMSQKAVTDALKTLSDDFNNKLTNYLPLAGGTLTGQLTIKQSIDIKLRLQSTDADNHCLIQAINAQASQLGVLGYAGDKWAIGHGGTYYEIWDKYNLTDPVTYTTNAYNHATLKNKDGQYFTYIKAGTNGLLPHSKATLASGGSGSLGTSDQSFNAAYINNLHTNKVTFGDAGPYITGSTSATQFLNAEGGVQKVATGGLYVGPSYASDALALVPSNGIYSQGNIRTSGWLTFEDNEWTDTGWAYKDAKGSIKVLSVINETNNKPTSYGSVLQFNSRQGHWCTQIWCDQTNAAGVIGTLRFRTTKSYASTEWNPWTSLVTEFDLNSYLTKTEASTLYYPYNGRGYLSITSTGKPVMSNNQGYAVKDKDGNEREVLWMGTSNILNLGNTSYYTLDQLDLRCVTLTHNGNPIATQNYVTNQLSNYLPLTGGTLSGNLTINTVGSTTLVINNNDTNGSETFMRVLRKGTASAAIGFKDGLGAYIYNYNSNKYLFIADDGYARVGTTSGSTRLALITDIPTVSGYLPLSGGTMSGNISFNGGTGHIVVGARETSNYVSAVSFNKGSATNSAHIGYHSTGGSDSSGALVLVPYPTSANPWAKTVGLYIAKNELLLDGKAIATQEYVTWNNVAGKPTIYERTIGINGTYWSFYAPINATSAMIYGPTSAGTSGQILQSTGGVPKWVNASSVVGNFVSKSGDTMTGALTMNSRRNNIVVDVVGGAGNSWDEGAGALSIQVPSDSGQTPLILARRSGAAINTTTLSERLLDMALLDNGTFFKVNMSGVEALQLKVTSFTNKVGIGKLFGKTIATTDQIPSLSGYATQSWANGQFASLALYNTTSGYSTIRTTGNEICIGNTAATSAINQMLVNYRVPSGCTYAPASWVWRAGSSSSYAVGYWGDLYMNDNLVATQTWSNSQYPLKTGTGASGTWDINISGNASTASAASKLGSTTIGGSAKPIYLSSGTPIACSATVGSTTVPVYMNAGTITQCSTTLGVSITGNAATATNATQLGGTAASSYVKANDNISRLTNDSGYATQEWVNSQNFVKSTSTKKVTDIQPVDALPATQASGVLYLVFG